MHRPIEAKELITPHPGKVWLTVSRGGDCQQATVDVSDHG